MLANSVLRIAGKRPPWFTLALIAGVVATTVPQFFLPTVYDRLTGTLFGLQVPHYLTLPLFAHSPDILLPHVIGNVLVLALFGGLSEIILGYRRFAILTLAAAIVSLLFSYLRDLSQVHGISGIGWSYHVPVLLALIAVIEQRGSARHAVKEPLLWVYGAFYLFDFLALPLLEVTILGRRFFDNFGQVMHLAAVVTAVPFVFAWRRSVESMAVVLCSKAMSPADPPRPPAKSGRHRLPQALLLLMVFLNLLGTADAVWITLQSAHGPQPPSYSVAPPPDTPIEKVGNAVTVSFSEAMLEGELSIRRRSIWYEGDSVPQLEYHWNGPRELTILLSRPLRRQEALHLSLDAYHPGPRGVPVPVSVDVQYGEGR